jgi:uncharacterized membrane protein
LLFWEVSVKNRHWGITLGGLYGAGALSMYFLDLQRGKRRRVALKDRVVHSAHELQRFVRRFRLDVEHRVEGAAAATENLFEREKVSDYVLEQRVRTALGRMVSHPHAIEVSCKDGSVSLSGWVMADELRGLDKTVGSVRGVEEVSTFLNITDHPEHIPDLQGGVPRKRVPELIQESWSPTARVIAGSTGLGLIGYGLTRRESIGAAAGLAGSILLARSVFNTPLRRIAGVGQTAGLRIQKTIHIAATPADLYEFWSNPENYPKVFSHVVQVSGEGEGLYRWHVAGPAGIPLNWTGRIKRRLPGKMVEWHSTPGSAIENHGIIRLDAEKDGRTRVHIQMSYNPPAGLLGHAFAALLGVDPKSLMDQDFVRLKALFEEGKTKVHGHEVKKPELKLARPPAS